MNRQTGKDQQERDEHDGAHVAEWGGDDGEEEGECNDHEQQNCGDDRPCHPWWNALVIEVELLRALSIISHVYILSDRYNILDLRTLVLYQKNTKKSI